MIATAHQTEICETPYTFLKNKYQKAPYTDRLIVREIPGKDCSDHLVDFLLANRDLLEQEEKTKYANILAHTNKSEVTREDIITALCVRDDSGSYVTCPKTPRSVYRDVAWGFIGMNDENEQENITRPLYLDIA